MLMMALAGQVFNFTIQSTGQATALTDLTQQFRAIEHTLREDLRYVQPGISMMVIQGNPVNAYWTPEGKAADPDGYPSLGEPYAHAADPEREDATGRMLPPRADILTLFTGRKQSSYVDATVTSQFNQVVYGHAVLGDYQPNISAADGYDFLGPSENPDDPSHELYPYPNNPVGVIYPSTTEPSRIPASSWHLARRCVLLLPTAIDPDNTPIIQYDRRRDPDLVLPLTGLNDNQILLGRLDIISDFDYSAQVMQPPPPWAEGVAPWYMPPAFGTPTSPIRVYARSKLDPTPPTRLAWRLNHFLMPRCASFKVEWSLDPYSAFVAGRLDGIAETLWFDPGHPTEPLETLKKKIEELDSLTDPASRQTKAELCSLMCEQTDHPDWYRYSLRDRFGGTCPEVCDFPQDPEFAWTPLSGTDRTNLIAFLANRPGPDRADGSYPLVPDDLFPGALRITIDVFDTQRRLDRPVRHVIVIPVGK